MSITPDQAVFLLHTVLPSFENEHRITAKIMKAVPPERADYQPEPNSKSAFDLCWHMAAAETRFMRALPAGEIFTGTIEKPPTLEDVIAVYLENFKQDLAAIKSMSGEALAKIVDFRGLFQMPAVSVLSFSMSHIIHHRGQLTVYLRPMGGKVPSIYGESYDDAQARLATAAS